MNKAIQLSLFDTLTEDESYLTEQIITYIGNKRALLSFIGTSVNYVKEKLGKERLSIVDIFSGSGVVSRYFKQYAKTIYANDLEDYCQTINKCYLANRSEVDFEQLEKHFYSIKTALGNEPLRSGFISEMYAPADDQNIKEGERVFYTPRNARYIDTARQLIDTVPENIRHFLLAPLLYEASVHNNTSGVFKGFYKNSKTGIGQYGGDGRNALQRILANIELRLPIFSNFECESVILQEDANKLAEKLPPVDLVYMDPPYNQHPYGSNYFMLNLINNYKRPEEVSRVSGIPLEWNKSQYNKKQTAHSSMFDLCSKLNARFLLISFSSDGFIEKEEMVEMLSSLGEVQVLDKEYNTFRGCRNLSGRDIHVKEYLYLVDKGERYGKV
jgi:adenine-specific DNA-methyltransferase